MDETRLYSRCGRCGGLAEISENGVKACDVCCYMGIILFNTRPIGTVGIAEAERINAKQGELWRKRMRLKAEAEHLKQQSFGPLEV